MRELGYTNVIKPYLESKREKDKLTSLATLAGTTLHNSPNPHNLFYHYYTNKTTCVNELANVIKEI